jgi:tetratricopeptide (TPR) repeat protein
VTSRGVRRTLGEISQFGISPDYAEAHNNLGGVVTLRQRFDEAIPHYREAIRLKPDFAKAHKNLGIAVSENGEIDETIAQFREAVRLQPGFAEAQERLRMVLEMKANAAAPANPAPQP